MPLAPDWPTVADVDPERCASAVVFVEETREVSTTLCLYNYFVPHYGVEAVALRVYRSDTGRVIFETVSLEEELRLVRCCEYLPIGFSGNLLVVGVIAGPGSESMRSHRLFQLGSIFEFRDGSVTTIHGQGALSTGGNHRHYHCFDIERGFRDVVLLLQNHSPSEPCALSGQLFDDCGVASSVITAPEIPPLGLQRKPLRVDIDEAFAISPHSRRLSLVLHQSVDSRRPLYRLETGRAFAINHGSYVYDGTRPLAGDTSLGMICCGLPMEQTAPYTIALSVDNHNTPGAQRSLAALVFDHRGVPVGQLDDAVRLEPGGVDDITPTRLQATMGLAADFTGHAIFFARPDANQTVPAELQFNLGVYARNRKVGGCMIGGYVQNTATQPGGRGEGFRRNRTFCPVYLDETSDTVIYLFNNSSDRRYDYAPRLSLTFWRGNTIVARRDDIVAANQMFRLSMREWLGPLGAAAPRRSVESIGWLVCRSVEAQLPGFYVIHDTAGAWADIDHLFGA